MLQYFILATLVTGLTWSLIAQTSTTAQIPTPSAQTSTALSMGPVREKHPEIRQAMRSLEGAKQALEKADHDFGGHRVKALEHVNAALHECEEALKTDRD